MNPPQPFVRESGHGPSVVCLHANASTSAQWRLLSEQLAGDFRVLAVDSYGAGNSPEWHSAHTISLSDEIDLLAPVLRQAGPALALVGHSYGATIALLTALRYPQQVRALVLYEPTLFALIDAQAAAPNAADGIRATVALASQALDRGNRAEAAACFIDYWMGAGSWARMPPARQPAIADSLRNVRRWAHALFSETTPLEAFRALDMPLLFMLGKHSPASAQRVAQLLAQVLPNAEWLEFEELGHMGPITHPQPVNAAIASFLQRHMLG